MTNRSDVKDLLEQLEEEYPERHSLETQPDWIADLRDVHSSIQMAYVRERGATPLPKVELNVRNSVSGEDGWYRIEATEEEWFYALESPPAGVVSALTWLRENVAVSEFRDWFQAHQ